MNATERAAYIDDFMANCLGLLTNKGAEYSRGETDVNSNFKRVAAAIGSDPVTVAYVYLAKHLDSIANFVKTRETPSGEGIQGRLHDAVNYLAIMGSLIEEASVPAVGPAVIYQHDVLDPNCLDGKCDCIAKGRTAPTTRPEGIEGP